MIFVDDVGITASKVPDQKMEELYTEIDELFKSASLPLNEKKKKIISHEKGMEILGSRLDRRGLSIGAKTRGKRDVIKNSLKQPLSPEEKRLQKLRYRSIMIYKYRVENIIKSK